MDWVWMGKVGIAVAKPLLLVAGMVLGMMGMGRWIKWSRKQMDGAD